MIGQSDKASVEYTVNYKEKFAEQNASVLERMSDPDAYVDMYFASYAKFYKNAFVGTDETAFGVIVDYEEADRDLQETAYATETELKSSKDYKEIFKNETEQNDNGVSGGNGSDGSL